MGLINTHRAANHSTETFVHFTIFMTSSVTGLNVEMNVTDDNLVAFLKIYELTNVIRWEVSHLGNAVLGVSLVAFRNVHIFKGIFLQESMK